MRFLSFPFWVFFLIAVLFYYLPGKKGQWIRLLIVSLLFDLLSCRENIVFLLLASFLVWFSARQIRKNQEKEVRLVRENKGVWEKDERKQFKKSMEKKRKLLLSLTLVLIFGILAFFKYGGSGLLLPLGISFYTFQAAGYLIDVYWEKVTPEENPFRLLLFLSFFPQIIQGPIAFYSDLAGQLYQERSFSGEDFYEGMRRILWGAFKKLVIADRLVKLVTFASGAEERTGSLVVIGVLAYAVQLYTDFSGGIDIAAGIGRIFGIRMAENFRQPYFSRSLAEYWHRWHITLGNWVRTYVFYPLSISSFSLRSGKWLKKKNLVHLSRVLPTGVCSLVTFLIIGIWHGRGSQYLLFGLFNGLVILLSELIAPVREKAAKNLGLLKERKRTVLLSVVFTFLLVAAGYYFDLAKSGTEALQMFVLTCRDFRPGQIFSPDLYLEAGLYAADYAAILVGMAVVFVDSYLKENKKYPLTAFLEKKGSVWKGTFLFVVLLVVLIFGYYGPGMDPAGFVYMQF